jgi:HD-like signal output (HDOD) protein
MRNLDAVKQQLEKMGALPTLPVIASQAMSMAQDPNTSMKEIADLIANDPPLSSKVVTMVNSACYALMQPVASLPLALTILGTKEIVNLVVGISVLTMSSSLHSNQVFNRDLFWKHSASCAGYSRFIADKLGLRKLKNEAFLGGLVHDIGTLILVHLFSDTYSQVLQRVAQTQEPLEQAEIAMLGVTHAEVGFCATEKWRFPKHLSESILLHHNLGATSEQNPLTSLLQVVELLGTAMDERQQKASIVQVVTTSTPWSKLPHAKSMEARLPDYIDEMKSAASTAHRALVAH